MTDTIELNELERELYEKYTRTEKYKSTELIYTPKFFVGVQSFCIAPEDYDEEAEADWMRKMFVKALAVVVSANSTQGVMIDKEDARTVIMALATRHHSDSPETRSEGLKIMQACERIKQTLSTNTITEQQGENNHATIRRS